MKKSTVVMTLAIFAVLSQTSAFSQENNLARFGIGVDFSGIKNFFFGSGSAIYLPVNLSAKFRLEPLVSIMQSKIKEKRENATSGYSATLEENGLMYVDVGAGLFLMSKINKLRLYYGTRLGYLRISSNSEDKKMPESGSWVTTNKREETQNGFYIGPSIGGEYSLTANLTLGAEAQTVYSALDGKRESKLIGNSDVTRSSITTRGLAFIRFYF